MRHAEHSAFAARKVNGHTAEAEERKPATLQPVGQILHPVDLRRGTLPTCDGRPGFQGPVVAPAWLDLTTNAQWSAHHYRPGRWPKREGRAGGSSPVPPGASLWHSRLHVSSPALGHCRSAPWSAARLADRIWCDSAYFTGIVLPMWDDPCLDLVAQGERSYGGHHAVAHTSHTSDQQRREPASRRGER
jgi:hypothetical protein